MKTTIGLKRTEGRHPRKEISQILNLTAGSPLTYRPCSRANRCEQNRLTQMTPQDRFTKKQHLQKNQSRPRRPKARRGKLLELLIRSSSHLSVQAGLYIYIISRIVETSCAPPTPMTKNLVQVVTIIVQSTLLKHI